MDKMDYESNEETMYQIHTERYAAQISKSLNYPIVIGKQRLHFLRKQEHDDSQRVDV